MNTNATKFKINPIPDSDVQELRLAYNYCIKLSDGCLIYERRDSFAKLNSALSAVIEKRNDAINNSIPQELLSQAFCLGSGSFTVVLDNDLEMLISDSMKLLNDYIHSITERQK